MSLMLRRSIGILIALFSAASLLFSAFIAVQTWLWREPIASRLETIVEQADDVLSNTLLTMDWLKAMSIETSQTISVTHTALLTLAQSAHETTTLLDSVILLTGETLPEFIQTTETSINSAKDTAALIDGIMNAISKIPFIGQPYNPKQSLSSSLSRISTDLAQFTPQLKTIQSDLKQSQANLKEMEAQVIAFALSLQSTQAELTQVQAQIDAYRAQIETIRSDLAALKKHLPTWVRNVVIMMTFFTGWMAALQGYIGYLGVRLSLHREEQPSP